MDDKDFPPLPLHSDSRNSPFHSRVSSYHSLQSSGFRSTTPRIPPGFELTHGHPVPPSRQETPARAAQEGRRGTPGGSTTVTPAVPLIPLGSRTSTPKPKQSDTTKDADEDLSILVRKQRLGASEISLGSPKLRTTRSKTELAKSLDVEKVDEKQVKTNEPSTPSKSGDVKGKVEPVGQKPEKIEFPQVSPEPSIPLAEKDKSATPVLDSAIIGTPGTLTSRPATPGAPTTPSEASKASLGRPRTLRLTTGTTTTPAETASVTAALKDPSAFPPLSAAKKGLGSRRPSLSSAQHSRPSTPAISERQHSHDASRASSPPHSIVGSAPERMKSKSQQKKDRKEKAKRSAGISEAPVTIPTPPVVEEVAPVIARQKKQKKRVESSATASMEDNVKPREKSEAAGSTTGKQDRTAETAVKAKIPEKEQVQPVAGKTTGPTATPPPSAPLEQQAPRTEDSVRTPYTLRDLYNDAGKLAGGTDTSAAVQKLLQEHVSPMPKIISSMIQSGDLSKDHPWLNPPNFNSAAYKLPSDSRRGQDYLDGNGYSANDAFGYIYLPLKEKQALKDGHAVSVADAGERRDDLLRRCLVTPNGWVLRHLSADESEKVLELEERRQMYVEEFGDVGTMDGLGVLEPDDYTNLGGGMERLSRYGERHGVIWVMGEGEQLNEDDEFFDDDDDELGGEVGVSDEEEPILDDDGLVDPNNAALDLHQSVNMPGAWDLPPGSMTAGKQNAGRSGSLPSLPLLSKSQAPALPGRGQPQSVAQGSTGATNTSAAQNLNVNLRAMDSESLQKRVAEKQKELEQSRKEMEKIEKLWNKKSKDIARWREGLAKG